jgi:hypothetical protein
MEMSVLRRAPAALPHPGVKPLGTHCIGWWMGPRICLDFLAKRKTCHHFSCWDLNSDRPARSLVTILTKLPQFLALCITVVIIIIIIFLHTKCKKWTCIMKVLSTSPCVHMLYEGVSKSFRTESITKWTKINTRWEATQRIMAARLTRLTHKIAIQLASSGRELYHL